MLRGPQGTLFGKNTTAGAINITSKKPAFDFGVDAELSYGQRDFVQAKASITGPIAADLLAFRLSGSITRRDGVLRNVRYDKLQNDLHNDAIRGQLLFTPTKNFSLRLIGDWSNFENECCTQVFVRVAPTLKPAAQQYPALAVNALGGPYRAPSTNPYDRLTDIDAKLAVDTNEGGVSAIAEWGLGESTLTSVSPNSSAETEPLTFSPRKGPAKPFAVSAPLPTMKSSEPELFAIVNEPPSSFASTRVGRSKASCASA